MKQIIYKLVDISKHNGVVNFSKLKNSGIQGVIIRAGYGNTVDSKFYDNINNAKKVGLLVGVYWFGYAYTVEQAEREAKQCLYTIKNYKLELPVFYDWEYDSYNYATKFNVKPTKTLISNIIDKFCSTVEINNYFVGVYANVDYLKRYINSNILKKYTLWCASWTVSPPSDYNVGIWQYGGEVNKIASKYINGCTTVIDQNLCFIDYPKIIKNKHLNKY